MHFKLSLTLSSKKGDVNHLVTQHLVNKELVPEPEDEIGKPKSPVVDSSVVELKSLELEHHEWEWEANLKLQELELHKKKLMLQVKLKELETAAAITPTPPPSGLLHLLMSANISGLYLHSKIVTPVVEKAREVYIAMSVEQSSQYDNVSRLF